MLEIGPEAEAHFPHKEITEAIIGAAFEVYNELGYGFLHRVYQKALQVELLRRGFKAEVEQRITVRYKEAIVGEYDADLTVAESVLVEVKIAPQYDKRDEAPVIEHAKSDRHKGRYLSQFRAVQSRVQTPHFLKSVFHLC